jgi:hypothetical protein
MSGIRYIVESVRFQPEHPDLPAQAVAHVCLVAGIGLSFVLNPEHEPREHRPILTRRILTDPQFALPDGPPQLLSP